MYTVTLPANDASVSFDANCPIAGDDTKAQTTGVASGGRLVLEPQGDATLADVRMYSPLLTPTTACSTYRRTALFSSLLVRVTTMSDAVLQGVRMVPTM